MRQIGHKGDLKRIAHKEGEHTVSKARPKPYAGNRHEPNRAERIARGRAKRHRGAEPPESHAPALPQVSIQERCKQIPNEVAARLSGNDLRPARKPREYRRAERPEKHIGCGCGHTAFGTEQYAREVYREQRKVEWNHRQRDLDLRAYGAQRGKYGTNAALPKSLFHVAGSFFPNYTGGARHCQTGRRAPAPHFSLKIFQVLTKTFICIYTVSIQIQYASHSMRSKPEQPHD